MGMDREKEEELESSVKAEGYYNLGYLIITLYALYAAVTDKNVRTAVLLWGMSAVWIELVWILTMDKTSYNNEKSFEWHVIESLKDSRYPHLLRVFMTILFPAIEKKSSWFQLSTLF